MAEIKPGWGPLYDLVDFVIRNNMFVEVMSHTREHLIDGEMKEDVMWLMIVRDAEDYDAKAVADIVDGDLDKAASTILAYLKKEKKGKHQVRINIT